MNAEQSVPHYTSLNDSALTSHSSQLLLLLLTSPHRTQIKHGRKLRRSEVYFHNKSDIFSLTSIITGTEADMEVEATAGEVARDLYLKSPHTLLL